MSAEQKYFSITPNMHALVDYNSFLESVARRLGCEPRLPVSCIVLFNLHMISVALMALSCYDCRLNPLSLRLTLALYMCTLLSFFTWKEGLLIKWWFYPQWSIWYRLRGPGSNPSLVHDLLRRVPLQTSTSVTPFLVVYSIFCIPSYYFQRFLSPVVFILYVSLKALNVDCDHIWLGWMRPKQYILHSCPWRPSDLLLP
jgi:dimethylaniline monooxygenase (N-oxide forming)